MKNPRILIMVFIAALIITGAVFAIREYFAPAIEMGTVDVMLNRDSVHHFEDVNGREHGVTRVQQANVKLLQVANPFIDSVLRALKIKDKQIQALTALSTATKGTIETRLDTVYIKDIATPHFSYESKWIKLDGLLTDPVTIDYETFDSLLLTTYYRKKWLLAKRETYVDAYSLNPAAHIKGLTGIRIATPKPKRFGIGPYVGYGFNGTAWQPTVGVALQYSPIRF